MLGLWTGEAEWAKFWLQVLTDLKNRAVADIYIACVDGLTGFPKAIETVFPQAQVQLVHCPPGAGLVELCFLETAQSRGHGPAAIYRASTVEDAYFQLEACGFRAMPISVPN